MKKAIVSITLATLALVTVPALASANDDGGHEGFGAKLAGFFHGFHFGDKNASNFVLTGTVVSESGSSVVVNEDATVHIPNITNGQVTVNTDSNTKIMGKGNMTLTIGQLVAGDRVAIDGAVSGSTLTATNIHDSGPAPAKPATTSGKVSAVSSSSITITNGLTSTLQTFAIDGNTKVAIDGSIKAVADINVGDAGTVKSKSSGSTFTATMINLFR